ncbi:basic amino acid ABC transporter substrate-binding protein [Robertmurraya andreesenii]|uniref:Polar amino acid transport system substrate-binding protein n=1 Tax=Anoxybacillus andreesenii TaxID=1325932 RepID=A0ABT9V3I1_9BACL|nr:basic amino acid ABC transporter substrate-binding protein [Robertmurraya andreesenii]MDQ0155508.1 polar amino acid transport system substrate-binding protein [Robertmurraya andreesenii]
MKRLSKLGLVLILGFVLLLSACGTSETGSKDSGKSGGDEKKTLRLVTDAAYSPMEYMDGDKILGFDIDFARAVAEEAGYELKIDHVGWEPLFVEIDGKNADLAISSITITDERKQTYDFSVPYYLSTNEILVPEGSEIKSGADLKDKVVAVQIDTTGHEIAASILGENHKDIRPFETTPIAIQELLSNGADAVIADKPVVDEYVKNNAEQKLIIITDDSFEQEFYGLLFPKGSKLVEEFNEAINTLFENGKYVEIYKKWFGEEPDIDALKAQS